MEPPVATRNGTVRGAGPARLGAVAGEVEAARAAKEKRWDAASPAMTSGAGVARAADAKRRDGEEWNGPGARSVR